MSVNHVNPFHGPDCGEVHLDDLHRQMYATDASIYRVEPMGVAFPRTSAQASAVVRAAAEAGVSVIPRGAGTGLTGGALGDGMVVDFARYNRQVTEFNAERRTVHVGAGVVLDQLNEYLKPHGLWFGPDVATSSRATLGGMISNNSSGARAPIYGTTIDHVASVEVILADGRIETIGLGRDGLPEVRAAMDGIVQEYADEIRERLPQILVKRWPGYALDRYLRSRGDLTKIVGGSEGTLAGIFSAELRLVPFPKGKGEKGLALFFFPSMMEAMQATVEFLDMKPAAIEHIDRALFDRSKDQLAFRETRDLLGLDEAPCESILIVEFYYNVADRMAEAARRRVGVRKLLLTDPREMEMVWAFRKAGLTLLTSRKGPAKPIAGIEDIAVRPEQLPEYVSSVGAIMSRLGLDASYYGHAASGLLHIRPVIDLHKAEDIAKYRQLAVEISEVVRQFKGSIAAEHGVGMSNTEVLGDHVGPRLMEAMGRVKRAFDPRNVLNPGKIIGDGRYRIETNLRQGAGHRIELGFKPVLAFAARDESFIGNLEQCNGCGGCRKDPATMCPTFIATGDEIMSTRGRANIIRSVLERRAESYADPLSAEDLDVALSNCVSCKACTKECPSNVNLALLKAELLHARHQRDGLSLRDRVVSNVDLLGRLGCLTPRLANASIQWAWLRGIIERRLGLTAKRALPPYAAERFDRWFARRGQSKAPTRGEVILWDDCFTRYNEPQIGRAAVKVLEAAGYEVRLARGRKCCGRPAFSTGRLDMAKRLGEHNVRLFLKQKSDAPIIFLEPSCFSMFIEDYRELGIGGAETVAERCRLLEQFVEEGLGREPDMLEFRPFFTRLAIHVHCHAKSLIDTQVMADLARRFPNTRVEMLDSGCCGMAGAFGMLESKYDLSRQLGQSLVDLINALEPGADIVASGTSCRHQIRDFANAEPLHMAEALAKALGSPEE